MNDYLYFVSHSIGLHKSIYFNEWPSKFNAFCLAS